MFSLLISVYCRELPSYLEQSLQSVISQTLFPDEIVLVCDGPLTDGLERVLKSYVTCYPALFKVIRLSENMGLGHSLRLGLDACSYDIVARMDTDDISKPDRFEKQMRILENHPEIDVVSSWVDEFEGDINNVRSVRKLPESPSEISEFARKRSPINHPATMFRKAAVIRAGNYRPCSMLEDYDLCTRMLRQGTAFYNIQESLLYYRFSTEMLSRRGGLKYALNELKFRRQLFRVNFISKWEFYSDVPFRFAVRIAPNRLRAVLYKTFLR